ncbi:hypothetical protein [Streptomyces sp. IBSBF 2390]|uniref:hypothetical protein n=1 Tax=Streptomyces sp. IBSBF 2390 TaxID=2903533 RepID=UPI002FDC2585
MARTIRNNSVRLRFATIAAAAAAVTGGIVLPATTAMAAPTAEMPTASPLDPVDPTPGPFPADPPPVQPDPPPVVTWGYTPPEESEQPGEPVDASTILEKGLGPPEQPDPPVTWGYTPPEEPEQPSEPVDASTILEKGLGD